MRWQGEASEEHTGEAIANAHVLLILVSSICNLLIKEAASIILT